LDQFKDSMAMTSALGHWSLGARAQRLPEYHQQHQLDSGKGMTTVAHGRLAMAVVVVVRWFRDLNVIFIPSKFSIS
jgi:hypothetical protein